nr:hypothetical protein [Haloarcula sp. 1CSR25-25]
MTTAYIADTGVFVRCGGPDKGKFQRLRRALRQANLSLCIPQRVYEELGGDPAADEYPSRDIPNPDGFNEGWIIVADELDYTNPLVSTVMDEARRFIANETDRDEDITEKETRHSWGLLLKYFILERQTTLFSLQPTNPRDGRPRRSSRNTGSTTVSNSGTSVLSISRRLQPTNFDNAAPGWDR